MSAYRNTDKNAYKKTAVIISAVLLLLVLASCLLLLHPQSGADGYIAEIYQEGRLLYSIPLNQFSQPRVLVVETESGGRNEIQILPGSIGVISADCPDKLCVHQGFLSDSGLPIICLPNRLVIQLRPADTSSITPDITSY